MNVLALDTSTDFVSICLVQDQRVKTQIHTFCQRKNSQILFPYIQSTLALANLHVEQLDLLIVNQGPGSYTGIRIGLGTVKTFAQVHQIPVVGVNSLDILANLAEVKEQTPYHVVLNCNRTEIYHAIYQKKYACAELVQSIALVNTKEWLSSIGNEPILCYRFSSVEQYFKDDFKRLQTIQWTYPFFDAWRLYLSGIHKYQHQGKTEFTELQPNYVKKEV